MHVSAFISGYLGKQAKEQPLRRSIGRARDISKKTWESMEEEKEVPLEIIRGESPEVLRKAEPVRRALLMSLVASGFGGLAGAGLGQLATPESGTGPAVGAVLGGLVGGVPAGLLTYSAQEARRKAYQREIEEWKKRLYNEA